MNKWSKATVKLATEGDYLDQLQEIYLHEEGERSVTDATIDSITKAYKLKDEVKLMSELLSLEKFPYKDSYVAFLRKDRTAINRNPKAVRRICDRLYAMGIDKVIEGVTQAKEANQRRGPQFRKWLYTQYPKLPQARFIASKKGIFLLDATEDEGMNFCNIVLKLGITKRPDLVAKVNSKYVIGESKFLSATGGNQGRAFDDGVKLASNADGNAYKVFILDGVLWIERGSEQYKRIDNTNAAIFSALQLDDYLKSLLV